MIYQEGYVYHIKDEYFEKVQDSNLMQNKEGGTYRPTFYCLRDNKTSLLWMVPLSSRVEKFKAIHDKQVAKYGKCLTIVLGESSVMWFLLCFFPDYLHKNLPKNLLPQESDSQYHLYLRRYDGVLLNSRFD